jgi:hypothetical protein
MSVVSLENRRKARDAEPTMAGSAKCLDCRAEWSAVALVGTDWLECPQCGRISRSDSLSRQQAGLGAGSSASKLLN